MLDSTKDWPSLIKAAQGGCDIALGQISVRVRNYLLFVAESGMGNRMRSKFDASDVVQYSMLDAQRSIGSFRGSSESEIRHWLKKIVIHNLTDEARKYAGTESRDVSREVSLDIQLHAIHQSSDQTPSWYLSREEMDQSLMSAVQRLPSRQKFCVEARHRFDYSFIQIASQLRISEDAARKLWYRAVKQLKIWIEPSC